MWCSTYIFQEELSAAHGRSFAQHLPPFSQGNKWADIFRSVVRQALSPTLHKNSRANKTGQTFLTKAEWFSAFTLVLFISLFGSTGDCLITPHLPCSLSRTDTHKPHAHARGWTPPARVNVESHVQKGNGYRQTHSHHLLRSSVII